MNIGGFSWKRLIGLTAVKSRISRLIGIPLSRSGRYQKIGRMILKQGCIVVLLIPTVVIAAGARLILRLFRHIK